MVLRSINARRAFIGCNGVDVDGGVTNVNLPETEIKRLVLDASRQRIVCADSSKLGQVTLAHVCSLYETDLLITDDQGDPDLLAALRETGLDVMVAATRPADDNGAPVSPLNNARRGSAATQEAPRGVSDPRSASAALPTPPGPYR
jgi:hypothetical protein